MHLKLLNIKNSSLIVVFCTFSYEKTTIQRFATNIGKINQYNLNLKIDFDVHILHKEVHCKSFNIIKGKLFYYMVLLTLHNLYSFTFLFDL